MALLMVIIFTCLASSYFQEAKCATPEFTFGVTTRAYDAVTSAASNYSTALTTLLAGYTGEKAELCKQTLAQQQWYAEVNTSLDNEITDAVAKLTDLDNKTKELVDDCGEKNFLCKRLAISMESHFINKVRDEKIESINKIIQDGLNQVKSYIDECVQKLTAGAFTNSS